MTTPSDRELLSSLTSEVCPACGGRKKSRQTFCSHEYYALTERLRKRLYFRVGNGYAEAVVEAMARLSRSTFIVCQASTKPASNAADEKQMTMFPTGAREGIKR